MSSIRKIQFVIISVILIMMLVSEGIYAESNTSTIDSKTISGKLLLPQEFINEYKAIGSYNGQFRIGVYANDDKGYNSKEQILFDSFGDEGIKNEYAYNISVPLNDKGSGYKVYYRFMSHYGKDGAGFTSSFERYYAAEGIVKDPNDAALIDVSEINKTGIDMIIPLRLISGNVSLPGDEKAGDKGIDMIISAGPGVTNQFFEKGQKSITYHLVTVYNSNNEIITAGCELQGGGNGYIMEGNGKKDIKLLNPVTTGVNFKLIKGRTISGTITLPAGIKAANPEDYQFIVFIESTDGRYHYECPVNMERGKSSAAYSVTVPGNAPKTPYLVYYNYYSDTDFLKTAYYNNKGTTAYEKEATLVDVGKNDAKGINMMLIKGRRISGKVLLPGGIKAPKGGLSVTIQAAIKDSYSGKGRVFIDEGKTSAEYNIIVAPNKKGQGYILVYSIYEQEAKTLGLKMIGYLGQKIMVVNINEARKIDVSTKDAPNISITVLKDSVKKN